MRRSAAPDPGSSPVLDRARATWDAGRRTFVVNVSANLPEQDAAGALIDDIEAIGWRLDHASFGVSVAALMNLIFRRP